MSNIIYIKRVQRVRKKLKKINKERFRLTVFRSSRNLSAQIIDDKNNKTLISATSIKKKSTNKKKTDMSIDVAGILVKKALEKKLQKYILIEVDINIMVELKTLQMHYEKGG